MGAPPLTILMTAWALMNIVTLTESSAPQVDVCTSPGMSMYCQCDDHGVDEARKVTCFVFSNLSPNSSSWKGFKFQKNIQSLSLTSRLDDPLTHVPNEIFKFIEALNSFTMNDAKLGSLPSHTFSNVSELVTINIERNDILDLEPKSIFHLPKLTKVDLADNQIFRLRKNALVDLPRLSGLYLSRNNLTSIEDNAFAHLVNLSDLDLSDNRIHRLTDETFAGLKNLRRLDLFRNQLTRLEHRVFAGAPNLHELVLKNNLITKISAGAFDGLTHLMTLELNHNGLRTLPPHVFKPTSNLILLELSSNRFRAIDRSVLQDLSHSKSERFVMYFRENPLHCVCRMLWVSEYELISKSSLFLRELRQASCQLQPAEGSDERKLVKIRIHHLSEDDLNCTEPTTTIATTWSPTTDPSTTITTVEDASEVIAPRVVSQLAVESSLEVLQHPEDPNGGKLPPEDIREATKSSTDDKPSSATRYNSGIGVALCVVAAVLHRVHNTVL